jgi:N-acetylglucosamine kinase-like BadF-type ATPase
LTKIKILIADSGSTKTAWVLLEGDKKVASFETEGMNPYTQSEKTLLETLKDAFSNIKEAEYPQKLFYYGAGCSNEAMCAIISRQIHLAGFNGEVAVSHDLMASARALFGNGSGIACILGTGSSSALFRKGEIIDKVPSLGYVLGDEGAGLDLGKRLLIAVLKKDAPDNIINLFHAKYSMDSDQILQQIYFEKKANKFLASFAPFVSENMNDSYILNLARQSFSNFIELNLLKYDGCYDLPVGFVGSVAFTFKEEIEGLLRKYKLIPGTFLKDPMQGLMSFHA